MATAVLLDNIDEATLSRRLFSLLSPHRLAMTTRVCVAWRDMGITESLWKPHVQALTKHHFEKVSSSMQAARGAFSDGGYRSLHACLIQLDVTGIWHVRGSATMLTQTPGKTCPPLIGPLPPAVRREGACGRSPWIGAVK